MAVVSVGAALAFAITATAADPPQDKGHYAVVNPQGTVVNVIVWDAKATYATGPGVAVTPFNPAVHEFVPTIAPTVMPAPATGEKTLTVEERLAALEARVSDLELLK